MKDYKKLAKDVVDAVGGTDNIQSVTNCMTRLRFNLKDESQVKEDTLKATPGVQGIASQGGQFQIIIGTDVANVTEEIKKLGNFSDVMEQKEDQKKQSWINRLLGTITAIFQPIIPAICGAGMLRAVLALLVFLKWLNVESQSYILLNLLADSAFYFLPIMLAVTSAQRFKVNPFFAAVLGGMLIHPTFAALVASGDPISFIGLPVRAVSYGSAVIPPILIVWFMSYIEKIAKKISPNAIKVFLVPLIVFLVTAPFAFIVIGPAGALMGDVLLVVFEFFNNQARWVLPVLMGAFTPFFVMTGMHYSFMPVQLAQYATLGYGTLLGPGMLASNIAQAGASLAIGLKTKDKVMKQTALSASATALFGITEPALYGVTMKLKKPLWAVVLAGGIAGLWGGLTNMRTYASATAGILALPVYITDDMSNVINAVICIFIAFILGFVLTLVFVKSDVEVDENPLDEATNKEFNNQSPLPDTAVSNSANLANTIQITSPITGTPIVTTDIPDNVFANEIMGRTVAADLTDEQVIAPFDGEVVTIFPTNHAIGLKNKDGVELLIHIGINTVELEGKGYKAFVKAGDQVKKGDLLVTVDTDMVRSKGYSLITPIVVTNTDSFPDVIASDMSQSIQVNSPLLTIFK